VTMVAELGNLTRFEDPRQGVKYLGLIPSEYSSGEGRRQGSITKAGNAHARRALIPEAEHRLSPRRRLSRRATPGHLSARAYRPSARYRRPTMPSAECCGALREYPSSLRSTPGHPTDRPGSAVRPSGHRCRLHHVRPSWGGRTWWWRAHSSRAYHLSYPIRVPRPAPSFHAAFKPHLAVTPGRFPGPSAPCPG
jgi:hypothetical protein